MYADAGHSLKPTPRASAASAFEESAMTIQIQSPILSPCIGVCELGRDGYCEGCLRSGDEIARWVAMGERERKRMLDDVLPQREAARQ
jgi:predicted Fe-S protein YdhL (DUF1289 family)